MAELIYTASTSLDGYLVDADGRFDWAVPSNEVHAFINDLERPVGTYLYGRRMYETMRGWQDAGGVPGDPAVVLDYASLWRRADKVVFSTTLEAVTTPRTALERSFDPGAVRARKAGARADLSIGGAGLAAEALRAGVVDQVRVFLAPVLVGGGTRALPDGVRIDLDLLDHRRFENGWTYQRYAVGNA